MGASMDWFEQLTGFTESTGPVGYEQTRRKLEVDGTCVRSRVNGRQFGIGTLELVSPANSRQVLLTWLGGGAFGNDERWIRSAIARPRPGYRSRQFPGTVARTASLVGDPGLSLRSTHHPPSHAGGLQARARLARSASR